MRCDSFCTVECLEGRRLLSVSLSSAGIVKIGGTNGNDTVAVFRSGLKVVVMDNGNRRAFSALKVKSIRVRGDSGNDRADLRGVSLPAKFFGDNGADTLLGSQGPDDAGGQDGDDSLVGNGGDDSMRGGEGEDTLRGGAGRDELRGDQESDFMHGGAGSDFLDGNDDLWEDDLVGGKGFDRAKIDDEAGIKDNTSGVERVSD